MAVEEPRDWIDRAIASDGMWEPPAHFADRLAVQVFYALPQPAPRTGILVRLRSLLSHVGEDLALRFRGSLWVLRQYRELLLD